jgi:transcription termination/antitermination protein NusG
VSNSDETPAEAGGSPSALQWYILKVAFNQEDKIRKSLETRIKRSGLDDRFGEILIPTEDVVEFTRSGKRRVVKRKLYPGYLMIQMLIDDDTWFLVRETTGIGDFTGAGGTPTPMDPKDVERIIRLVRPPEEEEAPSMKTAIPFRLGDRVRVKEGYFQNQEGDVDKVDEANGRVTVVISIFGRSTPVELDHWHIEAI